MIGLDMGGGQECLTPYCGGRQQSAPAGFASGDVIGAEVDRRYGASGNLNGVVRFYRNGAAIGEPLPIGFAKEAVLVVSFCLPGGGAKIVSFS